MFVLHFLFENVKASGVIGCDDERMLLRHIWHTWQAFGERVSRLVS